MGSTNRHARNSGEGTAPATAATTGPRGAADPSVCPDRGLAQAAAMALRLGRAAGACVFALEGGASMALAREGIAAGWAPSQVRRLPRLFGLHRAHPKTRVVSDASVAASEEIRNLASTLGIGAFAALPLTGRDDRLLGALCLVSRAPGGWPAETLALLDDLAVLAACQLQARADLATEANREAALAASEERYRSVVDNVKDVVFQTDGAGNWTFLSASWSDLTGFSVADSLGSLFLDFVHPDDRQLNIERFEPLLSGEKATCRHQIRYLRRDGGFRWVEVYAAASFDAGGRLAATSGTISDVHHLYERSRELAQVDRLLDASPNGIFVAEADSLRILRANRLALAATGYTQDEIQRRSLTDIVPELTSAATAPLLQPLQQDDGAAATCEVAQLARDGTARTVELRISVSVIEGRRVYVALSQDISRRRESERALRESEARFRAITESSPFGVFLSSSEGRCLYTNSTFRRLVGWIEEEADGRDWTSVAHPEDRPDLEQLWQQAREAGLPLTSEFRIVRPDGWTSIVGIRLTPSGDDGSYVGSMEDVTERITFEKLVQDSESRFRNLFEGLGDAVFVEGPDHRIRMVNPAGEVMFGRARAELVGLEGDRIFADAQAAAHVRKRMANWDGEPILTETCFARGDGSAFPGELRLCGYRDDSGGIVGFIGAVRDIQERRAADQKLRASEAFANAIFDNAPVAAAVFNPAGTILRVNDAHRGTLRVRRDWAGEFNVFSDATFAHSGLLPLFRRALSGEVISRDELTLDFASYPAPWSANTSHQVLDLVLYPIVTDGEVEAVVSFARDVTERKATEERAARLAAIVESTNDAIIGMDLRGTILSWNGGAERLYGYHAEEMVGHSIFLIVPGEHEAKVWDSLDRVRRGEATEAFEALRIARDGRQLAVRIAVSPIHDTSGGLVGASVIQSDITEQKRMEAELRRSSAVQKAILDSANVSIVATDPNGLVTMMNTTAQAWLGYPAAGVAGKQTPVIFHDRAEIAARARELSHELGEEIRPGFSVFVAKSAATGQPDECEWTYIRRNGERFPVLLSVSALRDTNGLLTGYLCVASDLTERKKWEDALRESEERYRATFESLHDMFYQTDMAGRFMLVSPSARALLGYRADELIGLDAATLYLGGTFPETLVSELSQGRVLNDFEADFVHKDGHTVHVSLNAKLVYDTSGQPVGVQGTSRDIGERKRAEEERDRIFRLSLDMIAVVTPGGRFLQVNPAWEKTLGYAEGELIGKSAWHFAHPDDRAEAIERARATMTGSEVRDLTLRFFASDGSVRWLSWAVTPVTGGLSYCVARDVTEAVHSRERMEQVLEMVQANAAALQEQAAELDQLRIAAEQLANRDMLTNTANRRAWFAQAHATRPTAVAIFDIDFFKAVNDTYGHPAGDAVLVEVARRLQSMLPDDAVLGRIGGEEFAVLFYQSFPKVREVVEAAAAAVSATPIALERAILINVSVSGGLAPWRAGGDTREQSLAQTYEEADAALYEAKATGRRKVVVRPLHRRAA